MGHDCCDLLHEMFKMVVQQVDEFVRNSDFDARTSAPIERHRYASLVVQSGAQTTVKRVLA